MVTVSGPLLTVLAAPMPYRPKGTAPAGNGAVGKGTETTDAGCRGETLGAGVVVCGVRVVGGASVLLVVGGERR